MNSELPEKDLMGFNHRSVGITNKNPVDSLIATPQTTEHNYNEWNDTAKKSLLEKA